MSRTENSIKNISWGWFSSIISMLLGFGSRTIFIYTLGTVYLGVNGLFSNILSTLSFAELGIGAAINFSLYKPLAENDTDTIKSLMAFYKKAYRLIGLFVFVGGILLMPFLHFIIKDPGGIQNIYLIYFIFLFNSSVSYFFTYKRTLLSADQKNYLLTNFSTVMNLITVGGQMFLLWLTANFIVYLSFASFMLLIQNVCINRFIDRRYSYLKALDIKPLSVDQKLPIKTNIKAMMFHKVGDLCINQTDNIIISSFVNIVSVGLISNYTLLINTVTGFIDIVFGGLAASFGNLIVSETHQKRLEIFNVSTFIAFWLYGLSFICFYFLLNPFISLWIGSHNLIDQNILLVILIQGFLRGYRGPLNMIKSAGGLYNQDKYIPLIEAVVNLTISIFLVQRCGLLGVFIGTIASNFCGPFWYRPFIVYKYIFNMSPKSYFIKYTVHIGILASAFIIVSLMKNLIILENNIIAFICQILICLLIPNIVFLLFLFRSSEFNYIKSRFILPFLSRIFFA